MDKNIKVGLYDWINFPRQNNFYVDDLPHEWRLPFYANEFESACLNLTSDTIDDELLIEWLDDLPDSFELSLTLDQVSAFEQLSRTVDLNGLKINYLIVDSLSCDILLHFEQYKPVLLQAGISRAEQIVNIDGFWTPDTPLPSASIALLPDIDDKRLYRNWIEQWLQSNHHQQLTLWLDGSTARYSTLTDLRTLVELMGY